MSLRGAEATWQSSPNKNNKTKMPVAKELRGVRHKKREPAKTAPSAKRLVSR